MIDPRTRQYFNIRRLGTFTSPTTEMFSSMVRDGILDDDMVALVAPYGSGKTTLIRRVKSEIADSKQHRVRFIQVGDLQDKPLRMGSIISALLIDLCQATGEQPMRASEARSIQLGRLLGLRRLAGEQVCLVIEDAHRLHPATLSALKLLREIDFNGRAPLLSVVLIGWPELDAKLQRRRDILTRLSTIRLVSEEGWMDYRERRDYLEAVFGELIEPATRERIARVHDVPVEMDHTVSEALREARLAAYDRVDERTYRPSLREQYEALKRKGFSLADIGGAAGGLSTSSVSDAVNRESGPNVDAVQAGLDALAAQESSTTLKRVS